MCGIGGEARFDGTTPDADAVTRMSEAMRSRGPDGSGLWSDGWVTLGHRRLTIIDLSEAGGQPMVRADLGLALVFNGCIYNYPELREQLRAAGHTFYSTSDTEVILVAYAQWGESFVDHLVGMFAIGLVDRARRRLVLARDRLGIKPLYLAETAGRLRFASTLPALLAAGEVDTGVDPVALHHYLSWHSIVPAPHTILRGVRKLPPSTVRVVEADGRSRERVYWRPDYVRDPAHTGWDAQDWQAAIGDALRTAVARRLVADVPVGVLLSGGLDSSLIVALLAEAGQDRLRTFSIGFDSRGDETGDEFHYSDLVARAYGTDHERIQLSDEDLVPAVRRTVEAMTEPMGSHDVVAFHLLSEQVARHVKVAQSGQGADEVFAGYGYHQSLAEVPREQAARAFTEAFFDYDHAALSRVVGPAYALAADASGDLVDAELTAPGADTALDAVLRLDSHRMLPDDPVKRVDSMSMAWGLEVRTPFLDQDLVALAAACPPEHKTAQGGKGVLKEVARQVLPAEVIDRPKGYFPVPALRNVDGAVRDLVAEALRAPAARRRGLFRPEYVDRLLADPSAAQAVAGSNKLWQLGLLELWLQTHGVH
ncbi:N-acetylglutaminylglutamine amidotransferase [Micromonospora endophytica]|uniref:asparagine synthase (glutamine-hydrolyzing) n=1 Tax=Micromonospora endophytica TaxID=515350 RepID=A0A2W2DM42_9ACTN|nr:N-acetylglutaminylglutamine amidotransferase [Micromonospora endophytica]PZG00798.1 N-acetylglutaminylglutamine amidotransferase [Micromonospora endophytica]RIW42079.1 N-acetylglutaminylglutamine amidotransferase [Micromonospora endophytica]BCJ59656.1 asparagine synthetase B [Micromonospora endophytica]